MKKHVELEHNTLIKKFLKKKTNVVVPPFSHELAKKWGHEPNAISNFFFLLQISSKK
jgi:hypothetical protein